MKKHTTDKAAQVPYPDLTPAMTALRARLSGSSPERDDVVAKWIERLGTIQQEMRKLERLEQFSQAVRDEGTTKK